jgi:hypothetical protein
MIMKGGKMRFDIHFYMNGRGGTYVAPNSSNPIESASLAKLLLGLAAELPSGGAETVGILVKPRDIEFSDINLA